MFSKKLIGTPQRGGRSERKHEFTPIGNRSRSTIEENHNDQEPDPAINSRNIFQSIRQDNDMTANSFFEDTENFDSIPSLPGQPPSAAPHDTAHMNRTSYTRNLVNQNGYSSIKESEEKIRQLDSENYRLKITVLSLQRMLSGTPEDHKKLVSENIKLQSEVDHLRKTMAAMNDEMSLYQNKENLEEETGLKIAQMRSEFKHELNHKDSQLQHYERKIDQLEARLSESSSNAKLVRDLEQEVESLRRLNEQYIDKIDHYRDLETKVKDGNEHLKYEVSSLTESKQNLTAQVKMLEDSVDELASKLNRSEKNATELEERIRSMPVNDTRPLEKELEEKDRELRSQRDEYMALKRKYESLQNELERLEKSKSISSSMEMRELRHGIKDLEVRLSQRDQEYKVLKDQVYSKDNEISDKNHLINRLKREIESLEDKLTDANHQLSELGHLKRSSTNANESQIKLLNNKIENLTNRKQSLENDIEIMKRDMDKLRQIKDLEIDDLKRELSLKELTNTNIDHDSKAYELESLKSTIRDLESMISDLKLQNNKSTSSSTNIANRKLEQELINKDRIIDRVQKLLDISDPTQAEFEIQDLLTANTQLKEMIDRFGVRQQELEDRVRDASQSSDSRGHIISQLERRIDDLEFELTERDTLIRALETSNNRARHSSEYTDLLKSKSADEIKIRQLEFDIDALKEFYEGEIRNSNEKIEKLERECESIKRTSELDKEFLRATKASQESSQASPSAIQNLLEFQLKESNKLNEELSRSLTSSNANIKQLEAKVSQLELKNQEILGSLTKSELSESDSKTANDRLRARISELSTDLVSVTNNCKKLTEQVAELSQSKQNLANQVEELRESNRLSDRVQGLNLDLLNDKVDKINLNLLNEKDSNDINKIRSMNKILQAKVDRLSKKLDNLNQSRNLGFKNSQAHIDLLENQLTYYKARLHDFNMKANDLQVMNKFILGCIRNSNQFIKNDVDKLIQNGIYPDYQAMAAAKSKRTTPLTLKVVAKFVLAGVRIKRRFDRSERRKAKLEEIKSEIERAKTT